MPRRHHKNKREHRTLQTLDGTVPYVDSGWTPQEWALIAAATARRLVEKEPKHKANARQLFETPKRSSSHVARFSRAGMVAR